MDREGGKYTKYWTFFLNRHLGYIQIYYPPTLFPCDYHMAAQLTQPFSSGCPSLNTSFEQNLILRRIEIFKYASVLAAGNKMQSKLLGNNWQVHKTLSLLSHTLCPCVSLAWCSNILTPSETSGRIILKPCQTVSKPCHADLSVSHIYLLYNWLGEEWIVCNKPGEVWIVCNKLGEASSVCNKPGDVWMSPWVTSKFTTHLPSSPVTIIWQPS